jgi:hypothetical protein
MGSGLRVVRGVWGVLASGPFSSKHSPAGGGEVLGERGSPEIWLKNKFSLASHCFCEIRSKLDQDGKFVEVLLFFSKTAGGEQDNAVEFALGQCRVNEKLFTNRLEKEGSKYIPDCGGDVSFGEP